MTIGIGDRLLKIRGTDADVSARLGDYFRDKGFAEADPKEVMALLSPGEAHVDFEATTTGNYNYGLGGQELWVALRIVR